MKVNTTLLIVILGCFLYGSPDVTAQALHFTYDAAGNQTKRELICIACTDNTVTARIARDGFIESTEKPELLYYPNPVTHVLQLKWTNPGKQCLSSVVLYAINGQHLKTFPNLENQTAFEIPFSGYPEGIYSLVIRYSDGRQQSFKIIKQQ